MSGFENKPYSKDDYDKNSEDVESLKKQMAGAKNADEMMAIAMKMRAVEENENTLMGNAEEEARKENAEIDLNLEQQNQERVEENGGEVSGDDVNATEEVMKEQDKEQMASIREKIDAIGGDEKAQEEVSVYDEEATKKEIAQMKKEGSWDSAEAGFDITDSHGEIYKEIIKDPTIDKDKYQGEDGKFSVYKFISSYGAADKITSTIERAHSKKDGKNQLRAVIGGAASMATLMGSTALGVTGYAGLAAMGASAGIFGVAGVGAWYLYKRFKNNKQRESRMQALWRTEELFKK